MSQNKAILKYLQDGNTLTSLEALQKFGCFRLASRISDLKKGKHRIFCHTVKDPCTKKHYTRYSMKGQTELFT